MSLLSEIYTVEYIEREASLIIKMFSPYKRDRKKFNRFATELSHLDRRIMKRLGVSPNGA